MQMHKEKPEPKGVSLVMNPPRLVVFWAVLGVAFLAFQLYVFGKWITGPYFVPTDPGPDTISEWQRMYFLVLQVAVPLGALFVYWVWLIRPWIRESRMTTDGRLVVAFSMVVFWDLSMNYLSTTLFYNAHLVNFGSWTLGSWPTWFSPNGNLLPEPVLFIFPGYPALGLTQCIFICWLLRRVKARYPNLGITSCIGLIVLGLTIVDSIIEIILIRTGIWAYPGAIHAVTLFAGKTYQFPLYEGILFGGFAMGATTALSFFRDDKGQTFVERGIDRVKTGKIGKSWIRSLAVYGFVHGAFLVLYFIPIQFIALNTDPFPEGYPSYMTNNMCVYGVNKDQCPGPGVMMPRPPFN